ncbi:MAG: hypothetical protein AAF485_18390, partial [Chloroflexota bacterium]
MIQSLKLQNFVNMTGMKVFIGKHKGEQKPINLPSGLKLYESYARDGIIEIFDIKSKFKSLCGGQWLITAENIICLATINPLANKSFFDSAKRFVWVADKSYQVANDEMGFLPIEIRGNAPEKRNIFLFIRSDDSVLEFMFVGNLDPSYSFGKTADQIVGSANFNMKTTLPSEIWQKFGGPIPFFYT